MDTALIVIIAAILDGISSGIVAVIVWLLFASRWENRILEEAILRENARAPIAVDVRVSVDGLVPLDLPGVVVPSISKQADPDVRCGTSHD